ncbi:kinase-like protein, partial [Auricularia subglabra TFB-10046 SS5]
ETKILAMIRHPNILPFIGTSHFGGRDCIISPWAANGPLGFYLKRNPEVNRLRILQMHEIASAVDYLHTRPGGPVIHGDICIDNVLVSSRGSALLADFGLSSVVSKDDAAPIYSDSSYSYLGRAAYNAPELYDGAPRSRATDIFALG